MAYNLVGDAERAIKYYKKALDCEPKHKEAKHNLELLLGEPYNPDEIIEYIDDEPQNEQNQPQEEESFDFDIPQEENGDMNSMFS